MGPKGNDGARGFDGMRGPIGPTVTAPAPHFIAAFACLIPTRYLCRALLVLRVTLVLKASAAYPVPSVLLELRASVVP